MTGKEKINNRRTLSLAGRMDIFGFIAAATGIFILFMTGWIKQSLPIGTILLLAAAGLVGFGKWKWTLIVTEILTLFIFVMGFIAPGLFDRLSHPTVISAFVGTWVQELGLILALVAGGIANLQLLTRHNKID